MITVLSCVDSMAGINDFITLFKKCHGGHAGNFETMLTAFNLKKELAALKIMRAQLESDNVNLTRDNDDLRLKRDVTWKAAMKKKDELWARKYADSKTETARLQAENAQMKAEMEDLNEQKKVLDATVDRLTVLLESSTAELKKRVRDDTEDELEDTQVLDDGDETQRWDHAIPVSPAADVALGISGKAVVSAAKKMCV